jgi:hypothetical protein
MQTEYTEPMVIPKARPHLAAIPAIRDLSVEHLTVIMPMYDRLRYLSHYLSEGFWDGLRVQIVCDG